LLSITGRRDPDDIDLALQFDPFTSAWQSLYAKVQVCISEDKVGFLIALEDLGKAKASSIAREIYNARGNTFQRCSSLWVKGERGDIEFVFSKCYTVEVVY
jgi:hypothetical protein